MEFAGASEARSSSLVGRRSWRQGPERTPDREGWRGWDDDFLLAWIDALAPGHSDDDHLVEIVSSDRHFFIRQMAAKRLRDPERLKPFAGDRHVGQILARRLSRKEDADYLERLSRESRYVEVRRAAAAQLRDLQMRGIAEPGRTDLAVE
jgi:hypothetical protein